MEKYHTYISAQLHMAAHQETLLKDDLRKPEMSETERAVRRVVMLRHWTLARHAANLSKFMHT